MISKWPNCDRSTINPGRDEPEWSDSSLKLGRNTKEGEVKVGFEKILLRGAMQSRCYEGHGTECGRTTRIDMSDLYS